MAEYLHPGVYIEEIERGPRPIQGVPTDIAAILGESERGSIAPRLVGSYQEFQRCFGDDFCDTKFLPKSVRGFFENGGRRAIICRLVGRGAATAQAAFGELVVRAVGPGAWGSRVFAKVSPSTATREDGSPVGFRLQLAYWSNEVPGGDAPVDPFVDLVATPRPTLGEDFDDLVTEESSPDYYGTRLPFIDEASGGTIQGIERSALVALVRPAGVASDAQPAFGAILLSGGTDDPAALGVDDYVGLPAGGRGDEQGLQALKSRPYRDVSLVYAPAVDGDIARHIVAHCEETRFRFAVIDCLPHEGDPAHLEPRVTVQDTSYAAFYYPWLRVADPRTAAPALVPPGGSVLGIYARCDRDRGVFKAPANEVVRGAIGVEFDITRDTQDNLNPKGVNVIRNFTGRGIRVWGARTLSSDALWKYISVRRLFIFLERSIYEGTRWVVFEPNDEKLWARVTDTIRQFLRGQWRQGALLGRTETEAFFIRCDRTTMTQDDIDNGRLVCEIGVAPVRPAEFVIFRIGQWTAESQR